MTAPPSTVEGETLRLARSVELPPLADVLDRIAGALSEAGSLGLISITVLERDPERRSGGWHAYDAAVRSISSFLGHYRRRRLRAEDRILEPSVSGNAFVLVLAPPRDGRPLDVEDLARVRQRVRRAVKHHLLRRLPREVHDRFGAYVGASPMASEPDVDAARIVYRALDSAFADALEEKATEARGLAFQLAQVLEQRLVRTVYQPVVDVVARRVIGYEALTRLDQVRFETIELLFRTAQDHDQLWKLERLCRQKALAGAPSLGTTQMLFLNIEPDSIHDPEFGSEGFLRRLTRAGISPAQVVLEMTEHSRVRDFAAFRRSLALLRARGFRLAMDDVGSGYAGLQSIAEVSPDYIKIDMNLVRGLHASAIKQELIATIRRFAESTGIALVAEGVEEREELEALLRLGVRCAQGYLFARPEAPPRLPDWISLLGAP